MKLETLLKVTSVLLTTAVAALAAVHLVYLFKALEARHQVRIMRESCTYFPLTSFIIMIWHWQINKTLGSGKKLNGFQAFLWCLLYTFGEDGRDYGEVRRCKI